MRILLILFFLSSLQLGLAQCTKKKDDMTGAVTIDVPIKRLGTAPREGFFGTPLYLDANMELAGEGYRLVIMPQSLSRMSIRSGELVYIKFEDDSVITLQVAVSDRSRRAVSSYFTQGEHTKIYSSMVLADIPADKLSILRTKKVVKIRCHVEDYVLKGKEQKLISEWINCMEASK